MAPYRFFSCFVKTVCSGKMKRLVPSHGASENVIFVNLDSTRCHGNPIVKRCSLLI